MTSSSHAKLTDFGGCRPVTDEAVVIGIVDVAIVVAVIFVSIAIVVVIVVKVTWYAPRMREWQRSRLTHGRGHVREAGAAD